MIRSCGIGSCARLFGRIFCGEPLHTPDQVRGRLSPENALAPVRIALNMPQSPIVFDRALLRRRLQRARALGPETFLVDRVAADLAERLGAVLRRFDMAVDLGTPTDAVREALADNASIGTLIAAAPLARTTPAIVADEEALPFRETSLDLIVSALALQFVNDLPGTLIQIRRTLKPDGLLLAAMFA